MSRTASATEAKTQLGAMIDWTVEHGDEIVIESRGKPKAVLISYAEFVSLRDLREAERRRQVLERLEDLAQRVAARNLDLTAEAAQGLADRFTREVIGEMLHEGKVAYQTE
jgi:prevent-host-death family protein